jgi:ubiquinone/menaquinone biosynthesis C-methylase UbiE
MSVRDFSLRFYWKAQSVMVPGLQYAQSLYERVLWQVTAGKEAWLELGCGHQVLPPWRSEQEIDLVKQTRAIVGLDADFQSLKSHRTIARKVCGSVTTLPFTTESFDLVSSNMVFEHLDDPERQLKEIARVLRPNGLLVFHTPNVRGYPTVLARLVPEFVKKKLVWALERRKEEDVYPTFYRINSPEQIHDMAARAGLSVVSLKMIVSGAALTVFPPAALFELALIKLLMGRWLKNFRPNIIAILQKPSQSAKPNTASL